jgi:hypothetical protein
MGLGQDKQVCRRPASVPCRWHRRSLMLETAVGTVAGVNRRARVEVTERRS